MSWLTKLLQYNIISRLTSVVPSHLEFTFIYFLNLEIKNNKVN